MHGRNVTKPAQPRSLRRGVLTDAQCSELIRENSDWARNAMRRMYGPNAEEYADLALAEAAASFNGSGTFRGWARENFKYVMRREAKALYQRQRSAGISEQSLDALHDSSPDQPDWEDDESCPSAGLSLDDQLLNDLRQIDDMHGDVRWAVMGQVLGGYSLADARRIAQRRETRFISIEELADAVMLFGAVLHRPKDFNHDTPIVVSRYRRFWPLLPWLITTLEQQDLNLRFRQVGGLARIRTRADYRSNATSLLNASRRRWYRDDDRRSTVPPDLDLTERVLAAWLIPSIARATEPQIRMTVPGLKANRARSYGRFISDVIGARPLVKEHGDACALRFHGSDRPIVEAWLEQRVPRCVWAISGSPPDVSAGD